jgi:CHAD domain-containing protein
MDEPRFAAIHSLIRRDLGPAEPVKAVPAHIHDKMSPDEAFRVTLSDCLAQMTANAAAVRAGRSVEGLHQLRVGFRRLDVALQAFGKEFGKSWLDELRSRGKVLANRFGPARDLDVFVEERLKAAAEAVEDETLSALKARAEMARETAWKKAQIAVASADFAQFLEDVAGLSTSRLPLSQESKLAKVTNNILKRQYRRAVKRGRDARSLEQRDLHRLRIALKKLRYTSEFFAPLYGDKKVKDYLSHIRKLQDQLGELNDIAHVRAIIAGLVRDGAKKDGDLRFGAGLVAGWYEARRPRLAKKALKRWGKVKKLKRFWK